MKQLFDYLPVVVFFGLYFLGGRDIYLATWGIIVASSLQVTLGLLLWRKVERMHLAVFVITLIFGGLTLFFRDDTFIKWRPSIISFTLAAVLVIGHFLRDRNLLQRLLEALMSSTLNYIAPLSRRDWHWLNASFIAYFLFIGLLNLLIAYRFSTDFWVNFKLFGFTAIQIVFYALVILFIYRRIPPDERARLFSDRQEDAPEKRTTRKMMLYAIISEDVPDSLPLRKQARPDHLARLEALRAEDRLLLAGPHPATDSEDPGEAGFTGSLVVARFDNLDAARAWADADPYLAAGVYQRVTVKPFKQVF